MGEKEIKQLVENILATVTSMQSTLNEHSKQFVQLHTAISTYHTEILTFSTNFRELEKDYLSEAKKFALTPKIDRIEKSISDFPEMKDKISGCPICTKYYKGPPFFKEPDYIR